MQTTNIFGLQYQPFLLMHPLRNCMAQSPSEFCCINLPKQSKDGTYLGIPDAHVFRAD